MIPLIKKLDIDEINTSLIAIRKLLKNVGITETNITNIVGKDYDAKIQELEEKVEADDTYSTTEVDTGKKWVNGKPIYRKCVTASRITTNDLIASNVEAVIDSGGSISNGSDEAIHFPAQISGYTRSWVLYINTHELKFYLDINIYDVNVWFEYTKTTD